MFVHFMYYNLFCYAVTQVRLSFVQLRITYLLTYLLTYLAKFWSVTIGFSMIK